MTVNWDDLKVVLAIAREGSLTSAAHVLGVDQSTAGRRLSALEAELGAVLFARSKTGFTPTEAGDRAIARAMEIEARAERMTEEVTAVDAGPGGLVRIIGNPWTMVRIAEVVLPELLAEHPQLDVRTIGGPLPRSLARADTAIAIWFEVPPRDTEFGVTLGDVPYAVYGPRDTDPESLGWLSFWDDEAPRRALSRWISQTRPTGESLRLTATDSSVLLAGIRAGIGKGLLPMCLAERDEGVVRLSSGEPDLVRALHLHAHPDTVQSARVQVTIRALRDSFEHAFGAPPERTSP
ncbi:MAG: LysR family transcriptional regulator [Pseudomonadota bacterium]